MGGRCQLVGVVTEVEFDVAEALSIRGIDEFLDQLAEGPFGGGPQLVHQGLDAHFTFFRGLRSSRRVEVQHGCHLAVEAVGRNGFPMLPTAYPEGRHSPPNFVNRTPKGSDGRNCLEGAVPFLQVNVCRSRGSTAIRSVFQPVLSLKSPESGAGTRKNGTAPLP